MTEHPQHDLLFLARMNIRYHEVLERRYESLLNWTAFVSLLLSSAAFIALADALPSFVLPYKNLMVSCVALLAAILNGAVLSFGILGKFATHADLRRQWIAQLSNVASAEDQQLPNLERDYHALNAREPAPDRKLLEQAYEETCRALGVNPVAHAH